jgi:hypothetical protein
MIKPCKKPEQIKQEGNNISTVVMVTAVVGALGLLTSYL